jgi:hypothetical protein
MKNLKTFESFLNEDRFGHPVTAQGNQIYIQLDKMEQLLSGKEKNNYMKARSKFWKIAKTAMEDEEQKTNEGKVNEGRFGGRNDELTYTWGQINHALGKYLSPAKILRFLSTLKATSESKNAL